MTAEVDLAPRVLEAVENLTEEGSVGFYASAIIARTGGDPAEVTRILLKMVDERTLEPRFELRCPDNGRRITFYEAVSDIPFGEEIQSDRCESEESFVVDETDVYVRFRLNQNATAALRRRRRREGGGGSGKVHQNTTSSGDEPPRQPVSEQAPQATIDSFNEYRNRGQITSSGDGLQVNVIGDHIHIDASPGSSLSDPRETQTKKPAKRVFDYARKHTAKFAFEVGVVVAGAVVVAILGLNSAGTSPTTTNITRVGSRLHVSPYGKQTDIPFTVENTARTGVWALKSPVMESFSGHAEPPLNAARWLPNGTVMRVRCARPGTLYELRLNGHSTRWRFFAELEDGTYMAMAGFRQTTEDGGQHLIHCEST